MASDFLNLGSRKTEIPLSLAFGIAGAFFGFFLWLGAPHKTEAIVSKLSLFTALNQKPLVWIAVVSVFNCIWMGGFIRQKYKCFLLQRKGSKPLQTDFVGFTRKTILLLFIGSGIISVSLLAILPIQRLELLPVYTSQNVLKLTLFIDFQLAVLGTFLILIRLNRNAPSPFLIWPFTKTLSLPPQIRNGIILGTLHEKGLSEDPKSQSHHKPKWVCQSLKGLTGNIFLTGAIGWGKSQVLLQFLKQCLAQFDEKPALLAIDPKRTFVRELRRIIEKQGLSDRLLWISLENSVGNEPSVRFNPIWRKEMLKASSFTAVANSLRLASMNFLGSSQESRFWEQSSFNLLKNTLIFCAANYEYFTFKDLYRALITARDEGLAELLVNALNSSERTPPWDEEERGNIEMAISYFRSEFAQMDEKIRTSILATATSFLNEFLEYRVSRVLSPELEAINLLSMKEAIQDGKLICLHIENDALARSIGTLIKLLYQEAVLARVKDLNHLQPQSVQTRHVLLVMDEYQDVATSGGGAGLGDDRFLAMARESKAITIAATQSVSSLENAIRSGPATAEILQNFRTRIFGTTTDPKTIRLYQEPHGQIERERNSHSFSESAQNARHDLLFGGYDGSRATISESVSTHTTQEYPVTAREFSRLRAFEAYAQIFDGLETKFEKLFLKPYFLSELRTPHRKVLENLRASAQVSTSKLGMLIFFLFIAFNIISITASHAGILFPNACSVMKTKEVQSCLDFQVGVCVCGWPVPRPCSQISYYVPQTFLEVWPNPGDSFFKQHPAGVQLLKNGLGANLPMGAEDDNASFSFESHAIAIPMMSATFASLPCGGTRNDKPCFDIMSEDLGKNWRIESTDSLQPSFLAWQLSPKACLLKGAAQGISGGGSHSIGPDSGGCSFPLSLLPKYPPSLHEVCNGWGIFFPRYGTYHGASRAGAALMIASRLKSLGTEVSHTVPGDPDEIWQMIYPQSSSCFKEGQNLGILETLRGVQEEQRAFGTGKLTGYLFVVWKRVSCCRDVAEAPAAYLTLQALQLACQGLSGGN